MPSYLVISLMRSFQRVIDTYRVVRIWHYKRIVRKRRQQRGLPQLIDENDIPDPALDPNHVHVLDPRQQEDLLHRESTVSLVKLC